MTRPPIPATLKRSVLTEAGHRCAIPTCRATTTEIAHIIPYSKVKKHVFENLIALCPNCHTRFDKGEIDRLSMEQYKKNLNNTFNNEREAHPAFDGQSSNLTVLHGNFNNESINQKIFRIISKFQKYKIEKNYRFNSKILDFHITNTISGKEFIINTIYFKTCYLDHSLIERRLYDLSFTKWYIDEKFNVVLYPILLIITEEDTIQKIDYERFKNKYRKKLLNTESKLISTKNLNSELVKTLFE